MRPVFILEYDHTLKTTKRAHAGLFHRWSIDYEELAGGIGHYPCAIVELSDGSVRVVPAFLIEFVEEKNSPRIVKYSGV